ncbi:hypothetical protein PCASD_21863 [Puccinia coronata f. sp. avenae]|uniref:Uncharacterized protein n=1 Tax=Puccinia coronata f. sp. avenae TaxID=200324 RepID=A0A2N5TKZ5_9BASI|nr:hypothetical protein PCASD_21863 [Puccinia coronata f. sp. avenae]
MLLALSSDSHPPLSKDDLPFQSPRTAVHTNHWRPPRTQGQNRPGPLGAIRPAAGLIGVQRVASTPTRDLANTAHSPPAGNPARPRNLLGTNNGASRQQALGWPPAGVCMDDINEPVDDKFVSEVDSLFQLNGNYSGLGELLAHDFVRKEIRTLLMNKHLAFYRLEKPRNSPRQAKSLLTLVLDTINAKSPQFKHDYLPQGYQEGKPAAVASVESFVRDKLRNSRGKMRDMTTAGREITHPVPNISALLSEVKRRRHHRGEMKPYSNTVRHICKYKQ